jgi:hypothetical protein
MVIDSNLWRKKKMGKRMDIVGQEVVVEAVGGH